MKSYFDINIFSKLPLEHLIRIVDHIETVLNTPTLDMIRKFAENKLNYNKKFLRLKSMKVRPKSYFKCILHSDQYIYIP